MIQEEIHKAILKNKERVNEWFRDKSQGLQFPFYSSFDLRESSGKVAPVDANLFPAGFNNICQVDKESSAELVKRYIGKHYPQSKCIFLLTEEHTNNPYYWDNVISLKDMIEEAGFNPLVGFAKELKEPMEIKSASGKTITVFGSKREGDYLLVKDKVPDLIISNNDFSDSYPEWAQGLNTPINPPREMGWHRRRKDQFFSVYNELAAQFAKVIDVSAQRIQVKTEIFKGFDVNSEQATKDLAQRVDSFLETLQTEYAEIGLTDKPFAFVKNSAGTYGLAVTQVNKGQDILEWNYKARKKMKAAKGGRQVVELVIQEGIPSVVSSEGVTAEPAIYMIGCQLAGGFLRAHNKKGPTESLNSPGAIYKRLCVSDLEINVEGSPMENVYGWVARIAFLAVAKEAQSSNVLLDQYVE